MNRILKFAKILSVMVLLYAQLFCAQPVTQAFANACAIRSTGQVIVAGRGVVNHIDQIIIAQYQINGSLDMAFGTDGIVASLIGTRSQALGVAIQPVDEKIVIAGSAIVNGTNQVVVARYTTAGQLDTTFNLNGVVTTLVNDAASGTAVQIDSNNKIVVAGLTINAGITQFLLIRYNSDGSLDTTFGNNGSMATPIGVRAKVTSIALQTDGQIIVGGFSADGLTEEKCAIARYNASDGSLDTTFGINGIVTTTIGNRSHIYSLILQTDGTIIVAGSSDNSMLVARYTSSGILDTSFNNTGSIVLVIGDQSQVNAISLDSNQNIVITGFSDGQAITARLTSSGSLDVTFGGTGQVIALIGMESGGNSLALQSDGSIIVAGFEDTNFLILRYMATGFLDSRWGSNGVVTQPAGNSSILISSIWEQQPVGTNGGTFTSGSWQTRTLNQLLPLTSPITLSNNRFTLNSGTYLIQITAPAYRVGNHQVRLQNITDGVTAAWGSTAYSNPMSGSMTASTINVQLFLNKITTFAVQQMCTSTENNDGFGIAAGLGAWEVYTTVNITPH